MSWPRHEGSPCTARRLYTHARMQIGVACRTQILPRARDDAQLDRASAPVSPHRGRGPRCVLGGAEPGVSPKLEFFHQVFFWAPWFRNAFLLSASSKENHLRRWLLRGYTPARPSGAQQPSRHTEHQEGKTIPQFDCLAGGRSDRGGSCVT
ncbi:hypothetical protein LY76DRAFT_173863 [Colletotrichum caudatum]|nr:hypothetical protein LY76DRAFT_173863 [Colletotrichum caudatum]